MYKELFDILAELRSELNAMETELKYVGHGAGSKSGEDVNRSLRQLNAFRDSLWAVDKALETERS